MNAALAIINAFAPKNEFEAILAIQIACCHAAGMNVLARVGGAYGSARDLAALSTAASRLFRVAAVNIEAPAGGNGRVDCSSSGSSMCTSLKAGRP